MKLAAYGETHPGYVRPTNEDAFLLMPESGLFVVADGMAGHKFGELASSICVNTIQQFYRSKKLNRVLSHQFALAKRAGLIPRNQPYDLFKLRRSVEEANSSIFLTSKRNPQYETMGTTVVAAVFAGKSMYLAHVGDSRIYRNRNGKLEQLTRDHSLLNEYLRMNFISQEEARSFPLRNVIMRALGLSEQVQVEVAGKVCRDGDVVLLCSDGLTDLVRDEEIEKLMGNEKEPQAIAHGLLEAALAAGGLDNITVLVVRVEEVGE